MTFSISGYTYKVYQGAGPWSLTACRIKKRGHPRLLPDYLLALDNTLENPWPDGWPRETKRAGFVRVSTLRSPRPGIPRRGATLENGGEQRLYRITAVPVGEARRYDESACSVQRIGSSGFLRRLSYIVLNVLSSPC